MTEQEAKTKECCGPEGCGRAATLDMGYNAADQPFAENNPYAQRATLPNPSAIQRRYCIGSACMAWRWTPLVHYTTATTGIAGGHGSSIVAPMHSIAVEGPGRSATEGFCGLAGRP